ncbi:MAG: CPBP family intramembrane metalloprotease [Actinomycetales bacterium]|nr:CPBP family intramembrane metalloprotease [Actinomycetales bacterium]
MDAAFPFADLALVLGVLGFLGWRAVTRERREYGRFRRLRTTAARQRTYRRWLIEGVAVIGGLAVVTVVGGWPRIGPALADAQAWPPVAAAREWLGGSFGSGFAIGAGIAVVAGLIVPVLLIRLDHDDIPTIGDVGALLPRTRGELPYGAGLALNAGISEELLFRLGLPALLFGVTGDGAIAFALAAVVFALMHVYQGPLGVLATGVLGLVFSAVYVVSGWIWLPIALHALVDLRSLVLLPLRVGVLKREELARPVLTRTPPAQPVASPAEPPAEPAEPPVD